MTHAIPPRPQEPAPFECCQRGCCPCIYDYYRNALERWETAVRALGQDPAALGPEPQAFRNGTQAR